MISHVYRETNGFGHTPALGASFKLLCVCVRQWKRTCGHSWGLHMRHSYWSSIAVSLLVLAFTGCSGGADKRTNPTPRPSVAYQTNTVGPGAACPNGGVQVNVGIDDNVNGTLETTEIDGTEYVCHGAPGVDGKTALVSITPEAARVNCVAG